MKTLHALVYRNANSWRFALSQFKKNTTDLPRGDLIEDDSKPLLREVAAALLRSTNPRDQNTLRNLLRTIAELEDVDTAEYVATVLDQMLDSEDIPTSMDLVSVVSQMEELRDVDTRSRLWLRLLQYAAELRNEYIIPFIFKNMERHGVALDARSVKVLVSALFRGPSPHSSTAPPYATMKHILNLLAPASPPYDPEVADIIVDGYTRSGNDDLARLFESLYISSTSINNNDFSRGRMHEVISAQVEAGHIGAAIRLVQRFLKIGLQPSDETLLAAMGTNLTPRNLNEWRWHLRYRGSGNVSAKVLAHLIEGGKREKIVDFYTEELRDGVLSCEMLHVLLKSFLTSGIRKPSDPVIEEALEFYRDYVSRYRGSDTETAPAGPPSPDDRTGSVRETPAPKTYQLLLRVLTSSARPTRYLGTAVSLVEDMHEFNVRIDPQSTASVIVLLMRSSPSPQEAMRVYRFIGTPANPGDAPVLNSEGYAAVLHTFCNLENWPNGIPSVRQYFEIVADMRRQGIPATPKIYTVIIRQLANLATAASASALASQRNGDDSESASALAARESIAKTLKHVHNQLTVNTEFTPDIPLWNQLMDAYQRAGCFTEALRIWHKQFALGQFTHASVSIIIDACAFNKAYDIAVRIYTALMDIGFALNLRNWNTFLECLCRLDKLDEAMKVLCLEMNGRDDGIAPDEESVRILIKFAAMKNQEAEVRSRVKRFLPKLYWSLPQDLR